MSCSVLLNVSGNSGPNSMQALIRDSRKCAQLFETEGRIDKVSENRFANRLLAAEIRMERFRELHLSERDITLCARVSCSLTSLVH